MKQIVAAWNGKWGKKNNWRSVDVAEWEITHCMGVVNFMAEVDGKVIRMSVSEQIFRLIAGIMQHNYGVKPYSKRTIKLKREGVKS